MSGLSPESPPGDERPFIAAIAGRLRSLIAHEPASLDVLAAILHARPESFQKLVSDAESTIDAQSLIDVVAALVREFSVDPQWLLSGHYDEAIHHQALGLAKDRSENGARAIHQLVSELYRRLRESTVRAPL